MNIQNLVTVLSKMETAHTGLQRPKFAVYMSDKEYSELRDSANSLLPFAISMYDISLDKEDLKINGHSIYRVREKGHKVRIF